MRDQAVLRIIAKLIIPFILFYALYVLFHGKYSPGGGFQAGVLWAAAFILHALVFGLRATRQFLTLRRLQWLAASGVGLYILVGAVSIFRDRAFLAYGALTDDRHVGQFWGIMLVEVGICLTVGAVMLVIFYAFSAYRRERPHG
jgi:multicomponent Na+:H+ antiporter subunit B